MVPDAWLADIMGRPVFRVTIDATPIPDGGQVVAAAVRRHALQQTAAFYYAKLATSDVATIRALGAAGMSVVDVNVLLALESTAQVPAVPDRGVDVIECRPQDAPAVLEIAGTCFRYSRFHLDPLVPVETAHAIKRAWIESYVHKRRGEALMVASLDGRPIGFLAVLASQEGGRRICTIDLIGVASGAQRRGVGKALVEGFIVRYGPQADELRVGTQVSNIPSLRLYEQLGFSTIKTDYVLHLHVPGDARLGRMACA